MEVPSFESLAAQQAELLRDEATEREAQRVENTRTQNQESAIQAELQEQLDMLLQERDFVLRGLMSRNVRCDSLVTYGKRTAVSPGGSYVIHSQEIGWNMIRFAERKVDTFEGTEYIDYSGGFVLGRKGNIFKTTRQGSTKKWFRAVQNHTMAQKINLSVRGKDAENIPVLQVRQGLARLAVKYEL